MDQQYINEINVLFKEEFNTAKGLNTYIKSIGNNIDLWVKVLVFLRKQGRYYAIHHSVEETKRTIDKCKWVGQVYVVSVIEQIPKHIAREVIRLMQTVEEQQKHMQQIIEVTNNAYSGIKAQFNLTPETLALPGATEVRGFY